MTIGFGPSKKQVNIDFKRLQVKVVMKMISGLCVGWI